MPELGLSGSVRGVPSNGHPYRDPGSIAGHAFTVGGPFDDGSASEADVILMPSSTAAE